MSEKSAKKWQYAKFIGFKIFNYFDAIFAQSLDDQKRLQNLTKNEVNFLGNLKSQAQNLAVNLSELEKLKSQIGARKFWLAASTHKGEEEVVLQTHQHLKKEFSDLLTIIVPRHPNRADEIIGLFGEAKFAQRSKNQNIEQSTEIYLADTLGELGTFYSLANFTFLGGSLFPIGGHNPFEPIKLNCGLISGEQVFNFKEIYAHLAAQNCCEIVKSGEELTKKVKLFLQDETALQDMSRKALAAIEASNNIAKNLVEIIESNLKEVERETNPNSDEV
jgi:3-deoxy-D-manno-octulosonic-acid transferase